MYRDGTASLAKAGDRKRDVQSSKLLGPAEVAHTVSAEEGSGCPEAVTGFGAQVGERRELSSPIVLPKVLFFGYLPMKAQKEATWVLQHTETMCNRTKITNKL